MYNIIRAFKWGILSTPATLRHEHDVQREAFGPETGDYLSYRLAHDRGSHAPCQGYDLFRWRMSARHRLYNAPLLASADAAVRGSKWMVKRW